MAGTSTNTIAIVQCSTHLVDTAPVAAFSVRALGSAGQNVFASTTVTELYNSGGYADGVYTAEQTGAYHFHYFARFQDGASRTPGVYVQVNSVVWQNNPTDSGVVPAYDDGQTAARHFLPYSFDIPLNQGDQVQIMAATTDQALYQEFSGYFLGSVDVPRTCVYAVFCSPWPPPHDQTIIFRFSISLESGQNKTKYSRAVLHGHQHDLHRPARRVRIQFHRPHPGGAYGYPQMQFSTTENSLQLLAGGGSNNVTNAAASGQYFEFTLAKSAGSFDVSTLSFYVRTGISTNPRGWVVRSSADNYAANIGGALATTTMTLQTLALNTTAYTGLSSITFRFYGYSDSAFAPGSYGSVFFTDIKVFP